MKSLKLLVLIFSLCSLAQAEYIEIVAGSKVKISPITNPKPAGDTPGGGGNHFTIIVEDIIDDQLKVCDEFGQTCIWLRK
jgi:hypothetical protein